MWTRPHETTDVLPIIFEVDGTPTTDFEVAIVPKYDRPTTFAAAVVTGDLAGAAVTGLDAGDYWAFPRKDDVILSPIWFRLT